MSQWAEIRHLHNVEKVSKKEVARRIGVDVKTVRRALKEEEPPVRRSPKRPRRLDPHRAQIEAWLRDEPKLPASRIHRLLVERGVDVAERTTREYVAEVRQQLRPKEAFVHRTHDAGRTMESDFFETSAIIGGEPRKLHVLISVLPASNAHFAKAFFSEQLECLLDGLDASLRFFGGLPARLVLDNASTLVKRIGRGRDRDETDAFHAWRGELSLGADFCAPARGNEKGSVEGAVRYVRNHFFRPQVAAASLDELNARLREHLIADAKRRSHPDGGSVEAALQAERKALRELPARLPATCRVEQRVVNKFGHVRVDRVPYSVPIRHAHGSVIVRRFHDRIEFGVGAEVVATHERKHERGAKSLDPLHVLPLLMQKARATGEATALRGWQLPPVFDMLRDALREHVRVPEREWLRVVELIEPHGIEAVETAVAEALRRGSPRHATVEQLLRVGSELPPQPALPSERLRADVASVTVRPPDLSAYDVLASGAKIGMEVAS